MSQTEKNIKKQVEEKAGIVQKKRTNELKEKTPPQSPPKVCSISCIVIKYEAYKYINGPHLDQHNFEFSLKLQQSAAKIQKTSELINVNEAKSAPVVGSSNKR